MKKYIIRQGDILLERVSSNQKHGKEIAKENGQVVLAHGEVTGHAHTIESPELATLHEINEAMRMLTVKSDTAIVHQEHARIELPAGDYIVRRQREYSPEAIRNVAD
jgi:hypothetical protein